MVPAVPIGQPVALRHGARSQEIRLPDTPGTANPRRKGAGPACPSRPGVGSGDRVGCLFGRVTSFIPGHDGLGYEGCPGSRLVAERRRGIPRRVRPKVLLLVAPKACPAKQSGVGLFDNRHRARSMVRRTPPSGLCRRTRSRMELRLGLSVRGRW